MTVQQKWHTGEARVVCATIAFGMGIDNPDVRFVIHNTLSKSIESYYQESGSTGRDNLPSECLALYKRKDSSRIVCMLRSGKSRKESFKIAIYQAGKMKEYCEQKAKCRRQLLLEHLGNLSTLECARKDLTRVISVSSRLRDLTSPATLNNEESVYAGMILFCKNLKYYLFKELVIIDCAILEGM